MSAVTERNRDLRLDAIAGFFIILMMFKHFNIMTQKPYTIGHIFMFYVCWFFFKSGMFHKATYLKWEKIVRWINGLIIPFAIFAALGIICECIDAFVTGRTITAVMYGGIAQIVHIGAPWWNIPIWFLLSLFFVKVLTSCYDGGNSSTVLYLLLGLLMAVGHYYLGKTENFNYVGNTGLGLVFYVIGFKSRSWNLKTVHYVTMAIVFFALLLIVPAAIDLFGNSTLYGNYFRAISAAILGMILINALFKAVSWLQIKPLIFFGQNAMVFMLFHVPITMLMRHWLERNTDMAVEAANWIEAGVSIIVCLVICYFFDKNKHLKWIIGG